MNDITSQLDINFGSLSHPGRGSRGARGSRGRGRRPEETGPRPEVVVMDFMVLLLFLIFLVVCLFVPVVDGVYVCPAPFCVEF